MTFIRHKFRKRDRTGQAWGVCMVQGLRQQHRCGSGQELGGNSLGCRLWRRRSMRSGGLFVSALRSFSMSLVMWIATRSSCRGAKNLQFTRGMCPCFSSSWAENAACLSSSEGEKGKEEFIQRSVGAVISDSDIEHGVQEPGR